MKSTVIPIALLLASSAQLLTASAPKQSAPEISRSIRQRLDAYGRRQADKWASFVSADCLCAGETKSSVVRSIQNRPAAVRNWFGEILDLQAHSYGHTVVVRYRVTEFTELNGTRNSLEEWRTETHLLRAGRWILVAAADNPITPDPKPVVVSREILSRYVGRYQYTPGSVDTITLEGDRLFVQSTGEAKVEILDENEYTFFAPGQQYRLVFVSDASGAVTSLVFRQQGQQYVAQRLP